MAETTPKPTKTHREKLGLTQPDDKVVWTTVHGSLATDWRRLLRDEGGTEASHIRAALQRYVRKLGYKTTKAKPNE